MTEEDLNYKMPKEQQRSLSRLFPQLIQQLETATKASPTEETLVYAAGCIERMSQLLEEFSRYTPKPTVRQTVADTIQLAAMAQLVSTKNGDEPISEEALATTERLVEQQQQDSETMALLAREQLTSPLDSEKIKKSLRAVVTEINSPKAAEKTAAIVAEGPGFLASILADLAAIGNFFSWLGSFITSCFSSSSEEA